MSLLARRVPLDVYMLIDRSGSMNDASKWAMLTEAVSTFVQSSIASGLGMGIGYFPIPADRTVIDACVAGCSDCLCVQACGCPDCSCTGSTCGCAPWSLVQSCVVSDYARAAVEIGPLPANASSIISSISAQIPNAGTPTQPALEGAIAHARNWASSRLDHRVVVVLATDGLPNDCGSTLAGVAPIAAAGVSGSPSIRTFVIGVGNPILALDQIATAGGTGKAVQASASPVFVDALNRFIKLAGACDYQLPQAPPGSTLDTNKLNVRFSASGGIPETILRVSDASQCDALAGGWYYDTLSAPTKISLCPAACDSVSAAAGGRLEFFLGCPTATK